MAPIVTLDGSRDSDRDHTIKRKKKIVRIALACITIANVLIFAYVGTVVYSVSKTTIILQNTGSYSYNTYGTPTLSDDTYDYNFTLTLGNHGIYRIQAITLDIDAYVNKSTADPALVPPNSFYGRLDQVIPPINPGTVANHTLILPVNATTTSMLALLNQNVTLRIVFSISTGVQQFSLRVSGVFYLTQTFSKS